VPNKHPVTLHYFTMTFSHSYCHLAHVSVTVKLTDYMETKCLQNLKMQCFILRLYSDLFGALYFELEPSNINKAIFF